MGKYFGTDGVRGVANTELSAELAFKLGQAGALVLAAETKHRPVILVGKDTRISCDMLEGALVAGICSVGADAVSLGIIPTPAVSYLTKRYRADAGVVISASHNTFEFNGIKFFNDSGYKLSDSVEEIIEDLIENGLNGFELPVGKRVGRHTVCDAAKRDYIEFLKTMCKVDMNGFKVALDCANGAAYEIAPTLFRELGARVTVISDKPDGVNINEMCGSTHIERLLELTVNCGADIGFAFDGDADRVLASDENGELIDGDSIIALIGIDLKKRGILLDNTVVVTVMSNLGLELVLKENGIRIKRTDVGDRYVLEEMLKHEHVFGGEQSGHVIFTNYNMTGDGLATAIMTSNVLISSNRKLSEMSKYVPKIPQVLKNARVSNGCKYKYLENDEIELMCRKIENEFNSEGRVLIRPSGTEPLVRVMIEGKNLKIINQRADELVKLIEEKLNV